MSRVVVIDYGLGNLHSVVKAFRHEGGDVVVSGEAEEVANADRLVLPGVGAFADGMHGLRTRNLIEPIQRFVARGRPFLGICLGMQLLLSESEEFGRHDGLGLIAGSVVKIPRAPGRKVPHIGWNRMHAVATWQASVLEGLEEGAMMYFVHSFTAMPTDSAHRLADADYAGFRLSAVIRRDNVVGTQFHPEKSGTAGLSIIRSYLQT